MRLSHVKNRIEQQALLREQIVTAYDQLIRNGIENVSPQRIQVRLGFLHESWSKFAVTHDAIILSMNLLSSEDRTYLQNFDYFVDNVFFMTQERYLDSIERMNLLLESEHSMNETSSTQLTSQNSQTSSIPTFFSHTRLPRIQIPKFNGSPADWLSFKDLFNSIVIANPSLSCVEKLQYLKTSLTGSAAQFLKNTALTSDNFQKAWDALTAFFENKRILVNSALSSLLNLKRMTKESSSEMELLYTNIMQIYRTLETLRRPVDSWDDFLVFIAVQRLDSDSVKAWEHHLGPSKEPPTWQQFSEFLITRLLSLQAFEKSRGTKGTVQPRQTPIKAHFQGKLKDQSALNSKVCGICSENHHPTKCPQYEPKTLPQRLALIMKHKLCYNCLGSHRVATCKVTKRCVKCGNKHHTTIHKPEVKPKVTTSEALNSENHSDSASKPIQSNVLHSSSKARFSLSSVLLATARVNLLNERGERREVRILIDQGSEVSLIRERVVQLMRIPRKMATIPLVGVGGEQTNKTKGLTSFILQSLHDSQSSCSVIAHILPKLTTPLPSAKVVAAAWPHLAELELADPEFLSPGAIDIIIGADFYGHIIQDGLVKGVLNSPTAQRTIFGWVISGPCGSQPNPNLSVSGSCGFEPTPVVSQSYHVSLDRELLEVLSRFWELEGIPCSSEPMLSTEHQACEDHFQSTHSRDENGRYIVRLPFKESVSQLGNSKIKAFRLISKMKNTLAADPSYKSSYFEFMNEYEQLQHMRIVSDQRQDPPHVYYLPHHGVKRETSLTTKLRVVFNGSSRTTSGVSLNDILHTGEKLQIDLFNVLIWMRKFFYVFSADIEKMYRQIKVHSDDWKFQRVLWFDQSGNIASFQLTTVTYGLACAPFLALRTLLQLVKDHGYQYPLAVPSLTKGRYVDDIFGGADSIQQAQEIVQQLDLLCMAGGLPLRKWICNHPDILTSVQDDKKIFSSSVAIEDNTMVTTLGLFWQPSTDTFHFRFRNTSNGSITKRLILSTIAKCFDPLGFLSPISIKAKILLQELWSLKLEWDDPLPPPLSSEWTNFLQDLQKISNLTFPRWLGSTSKTKLEIHGFCDASQRAMAAVVYLRATSPDETSKVTLICAKTKVAPLKRLTIPRLELVGAVLLTKLTNQVIHVLELQSVPIYLWTDSSVTYTWISQHPSKWKEFVQNRVCFIQETLPHALWKFVSGKDNPADCATRGLSSVQLMDNSSWWNGPLWLSQPSSFWPTDKFKIVQRVNLEERQSQALTSLTVTVSEPWDLLDRYSNITKLFRITALCRRFILRLRKTPDSSITMKPLTTLELEEAKLFWVGNAQRTGFHDEIDTLSKGLTLSRSNPLVRLVPFLDSGGLLRLGGRLQASLLPHDTKHPLILPRSSPLSTLIIADAHQRTLHGGTQTTLSFIRQYYWIVGGRTPVRSFILKCVRCARYRQQRAQQLMGQLPAFAATPSRPFLHTGIDYAGPLMLKTWRASLKELGDLASLLANNGTQWIFNPPSAPHFGGKWEAGVKSTKFHLRRVVGDHLLTFEEMSTLLTQIEAVLNSRPLCPITNDPDDLSVLTPGHFLIGNAPIMVPEPSLGNVKITHLTRWQLLRQMLDSFWSRWSTECLQRHLSVFKWNKPQPSLTAGTLVLIVDERYPPSKWPLGRIVETHPGKDGLVRVVTVKTQTSTFKRPITKICPLPAHS